MIAALVAIRPRLSGDIAKTADRTGFNAGSSSPTLSTASKPASRGAARGRQLGIRLDSQRLFNRRQALGLPPSLVSHPPAQGVKLGGACRPIDRRGAQQARRGDAHRQPVVGGHGDPGAAAVGGGVVNTAAKVIRDRASARARGLRPSSPSLAAEGIVDVRPPGRPGRADERAIVVKVASRRFGIPLGRLRVARGRGFHDSRRLIDDYVLPDVIVGNDLH